MDSEANSPLSLTESLLRGDKLQGIDALLQQVAEKLDAGMCSHCGGPRGEAAGMASLTRMAMKLLEMKDELTEDPQSESTRDDLAKRRAERRRAAAAQDPMDAIRNHLKFRP